MSVNNQSNFQLVNFFIGDYPPIGVNQVLYVKYTEDMRQATTTMEVQITDSSTGFLSELQGMEPVFIRIADSENKTEVGGSFVVYDIQDRRNIGGKSSAVLMLCTPDFLNNAANKVSNSVLLWAAVITSPSEYDDCLAEYPAIYLLAPS